jgi:hypothetical protein
MDYNFARIHKTLRVTPAMAAGLADHVWSLATAPLSGKIEKGETQLASLLAEGKEFRARMGPSDLTESTEIFPSWFESSN